MTRTPKAPAPDWQAIAICWALLIFIALTGLFAVIGLIDGWPRLELALYGARPV